MALLNALAGAQETIRGGIRNDQLLSNRLAAMKAEQAEVERLNALSQSAGGQFAEGNLTGARDTLARGGDIRNALAFQGEITSRQKAGQEAQNAALEQLATFSGQILSLPPEQQEAAYRAALPQLTEIAQRGNLPIEDDGVFDDNDRATMRALAARFGKLPGASGGPEFGVSPVYYEDEKGNVRIAQLSKEGGARPVDLRGRVVRPAQRVGGALIDPLSTETRRNVTPELEAGAAAEARGKKVTELTITELSERREAAQDAAQSILANQEARRLLDSGVITGTGSDFLTGFGRALQQVGIRLAPDEVANTEAFVASRAREVGRIIKLFGAGTGLSDADREFATQAAAGKVTMSEQAIRRILDINDRAALNIIQNFNRDVTQSPEIQRLSPFKLSVDIPGAAQAEFVDESGQPAMLNGEPVTAEDIAFTAREEGISEEAVMRRLGVKRAAQPAR